MRAEVHVATEGHEWVGGPDTARDCVDVCSLLPPKAIQMSVVEAAA